jgi:ATP-dependent Clp protease ATP-binding subunit ClpA
MPNLEKYGPAVRQCIGRAAEFATQMRAPEIEGAHLLLALLRSGVAGLDEFLSRRCAGLRAATVADSLEEILTFRGGKGGSPALSEGARRQIEKAAEIAGQWGNGTVPALALARVLFEAPERPVKDAFGDAGISETTLRSLASEITPRTESSDPVIGNLIEESRFGPVATQVIHMLASMNADRALTDADVLFAVISSENSRTLEGLHVMGLSAPDIRRQLQRTAAAVGAVKNLTLDLNRLSRLMRRVFDEAGDLARWEGCSKVSEAHLVRVHVNKVAGGSGNIYERLGIEPEALGKYLARYPTDRETAPATKTEATVPASIESFLKARVVHQEEAVERATRALKLMRSGLAEAGQVLGKFLFLGATGVGKTELARAMADAAFGPKPGAREPYLIKIDCGNFQNKWDIVQLLGAAQGLVGYKEGQLTNGLREKPRSVILFDEAEKAHKQIWQSLLPLFDDGVVRDADGTEYDATGCIIICTSNKGYQEAAEKFDLWNECTDWEAVRGEVKQHVWNCMHDYFSPEFLGRFGSENVIFFNHFSPADYLSIVRIQIGAFREEMQSRGIQVDVDDAACKWLAESAWKKRGEGARPVRRLIRDNLRDQLVAFRADNPSASQFNFGAASDGLVMRGAG